MQDLNDKVTGDTLTAAEFVQIPSELQNAITSSGQTLSSGDLQQLVKAISAYSAGGNFYSVGGSANAITLSTIGGKVAPPTYFVGMKVAFFATSANTSSVTVNVAGLGSKNIQNYFGSTLLADEITAGQLCELVYDGTNFLLPPSQSKVFSGFNSMGSTPYILDASTDPVSYFANNEWSEGIVTSVGPTGASSVDDVWTELDQIPLSAKSVTVRLYLDLDVLTTPSGSTGDQVLNLFLGPYSASSADLGHDQFSASSVSYLALDERYSTRDVRSFDIPLDEQNRFKGYWQRSGNQGTNAVIMSVIGFRI